MVNKYALLPLAVFPLLVNAGEPTFREAKSRADLHEQRLAPQDMQRLVAAQGRLAAVAFPQCVQRSGATPPDFTIVVEVGANGRVRRSWRRGESAFAQCFEKQMTQDFRFVPTSQPFFTAFEYTSAP